MSECDDIGSGYQFDLQRLADESVRVRTRDACTLAPVATECCHEFVLTRCKSAYQGKEMAPCYLIDELPHITPPCSSLYGGRLRHPHDGLLHQTLEIGALLMAGDPFCDKPLLAVLTYDAS